LLLKILPASGLSSCGIFREHFTLLQKHRYLQYV